jgi:hypothetical protein
LSKLLVAVEGNCKVVLQCTEQCVGDFPLQEQIIVPNITAQIKGILDGLYQRALEEVMMLKRMKAKIDTDWNSVNPQPRDWGF